METMQASGPAVEAGRAGLYRTAGGAALAMLVLIPAQILLFALWPPPESISAWYRLLQEAPLLGLLHLDLLYAVDNVLLVPIYLALFLRLRRAAPSLSLLALALGGVGIAAYFGSTVAFEMLTLSGHHAEAASPGEAQALLAAGQAMLARYKGTAFDAYYVLNGVALILFAAAMLRTGLFGRWTGRFCLLAALLMVVPSTAGTVGIVLSLLSLIPWVVFLALLAPRLLRGGGSGA